MQQTYFVFRTQEREGGGGGEVRQLPDQAAEHLHGERGRGEQVSDGARQGRALPPRPSHPHLERPTPSAF
jgi:hypothetical protein